MIVWKKLVKRWVEETNGRRETAQLLEHSDEVRALIRQQLRERFFPLVGVFRENHFAHGVNAIALEKHVLGAAQSNARRAETDGVTCLLGVIRIGSNFETRDL